MAPRSSKPEPPRPLHEQTDPTNSSHDDPSANPKAVENFSKLYFWGERYHDKLEKYFGNSFGSFLASVAVFLLGITARGKLRFYTKPHG